MPICTLLLLLSVQTGASAASAAAGFFAGVQPDCGDARECRQLALAAIASGDYVQAHDYAWRVVQLSPPRDPAALLLLARAQSLSGRGRDAYVVLRRLADAGVVVNEVETSDEFRRVREDPRWPELLALYAELRTNASATTSPSSARQIPVDAPERETPAREVPAREGAMSTPPAARVADSPSPASASVPRAPRARDDAPAETAAPAAMELRLPPQLVSPTALAYDAVSGRFVLATASGDALHVLSEVSGNAVRLVAEGWAGDAHPSAVAIDARRGDLWVAANGSRRSTLHQLQLISGRHLRAFDVPADAGPAHLVSLAVGRDAIYALDTADGRVFSLENGSPTPRVVASLPPGLKATSLAAAPSSLYVSHTRGLVRIDLPSGRARPVAMPEDTEPAAFHAIAWHGSTIVGIRSSGEGSAAVRLFLDRRGRAITRVETLGPAAAPVAILARDVFYYLAAASNGEPLVRGIPLAK